MGFEMPKGEKPWLENLIAQLQVADERPPGLRETLCVVRGLPPARYPDDQWKVAKALFHVLRRALAELGVLFAERGVCDFTEIALTARRLLHSDPDLLAGPGAQLAHLLVDEMQDTSAGQYELLELLTRSWDGGTQTVFLVGDPKQSIYLFRQARVARFLRTQSSGRLGEVPLTALRLTANFRSQATLVDQFNEIFGKILPPPEEIVRNSVDSFESAEVPFVAAVAARAPGYSRALHWHARIVANPEPGPADQDDAGDDIDDPTAGDEAFLIRNTIEDFRTRWSMEGHAKAARIAVLARGRAHLAPVIAEFHRDRWQGSLPFRAVEIEVLSEREEILDLLALTRALLHPGDRVAWLAVLRSPRLRLEVSPIFSVSRARAPRPIPMPPPATWSHRAATCSAPKDGPCSRARGPFLTGHNFRSDAQPSARTSSAPGFRSEPMLRCARISVPTLAVFSSSCKSLKRVRIRSVLPCCSVAWASFMPSHSPHREPWNS